MAAGQPYLRERELPGGLPKPRAIPLPGLPDGGQDGRKRNTPYVRQLRHTAIAIIFAIIKLNPVPFCILDEVDAPLDDSNSSVYAKYLRKFSRNTQFIIVSHRKPTMELANELYGITMQEKGVSKVFSVKLSEALQIAEKANNGG